MCATPRKSGQALFCDERAVDSTEFGPEHEVLAFTFTSAAHQNCLGAEFNGTSQPHTTVQAELPANMWKFELSSSPEAAADTRALPPRMSYQAVVDKLVALSMGEHENGSESVQALKRFFGYPFQQGDPRARNVARRDLFWKLKEFYGSHTLPDPQIEALLNFLDPDLNRFIELVYLFEVLSPGVRASALEKPATGVGAERSREALWPSADSQGTVAGWSGDQLYMAPPRRK